MKKIILYFLCFTMIGCNQKKSEILSVKEANSNDFEVVVISSHKGKDQIGIRFDSGRINQITFSKNRSKSPIISYDGKVVLFRRADVDAERNQNSIIAYNIANNSEKNILSGDSLKSISWSPKQLSFCYVVGKGNDAGVWIYDMKTNTKKRILNNPKSGFSCWSPCGDYIAYYTDLNKVGIYNIKTEKSKVIYENVNFLWGLYWAKNGKLSFPIKNKGYGVYQVNTGDFITQETRGKNYVSVNQRINGWSQ